MTAPPGFMIEHLYIEESLPEARSAHVDHMHLYVLRGDTTSVAARMLALLEEAKAEWLAGGETILEIKRGK